MPNNHTEEITDLLGTPPAWIPRYGISVIAGAICVVFALSWCIKYPDIVKAEIVLSSAQPPVNIVAKNGGKIALWNAIEGQTVEKGAVLGVLQSTARTEDVLLLAQKTSSIAPDLSNIISLQTNAVYQLGEVQVAYSEFRTVLDGFLYFRKNDVSPAQLANTNTQIAHYETLITALQHQIATLKIEVDLAQKNWQRNQDLLKEGVVAPLEVEQKQQTYLQYKRQLEQTESQIINYNIQIAQQKSQLLAANHTNETEESTRSIALREALRRLQVAILAWKENYLLQAPIAGRVTLPVALTIGQTTEPNKPLATVLPSSQAIVGRVALPPNRSGTVQTGQEVHVKLANYPYQEYGILCGTVGSIGLVATDKNYPLEVVFPADLQTTSAKRIDLKQDMRGTAEIVTRPRRLLQRFLAKCVGA